MEIYQHGQKENKEDEKQEETLDVEACQTKLEKMCRDKKTPEELVQAFRDFSKIPVYSREDEILIEANAGPDRYYRDLGSIQNMEDLDKNKVRNLTLIRQLDGGEGGFLQVALNLVFVYNEEYGKKYDFDFNSHSGLLRFLQRLRGSSHSIWIKHPSDNRKANKRIEDIISHFKFKEYHVVEDFTD